MAAASFDKATYKVLTELSDKKVGVFIDDSNLYHAYKKYSWRVDLGKLKALLEAHCDLKFINYHIGIPAKSDENFKGTESYLRKLQGVAAIKPKPLKYIQTADKIVKKADVDVEIVLDVVRTIDQLDGVIIISGDSDFLELRNYVLKDKHKIIIFWAHRKSIAWELKLGWYLFLDDFEEEISIKTTPGGKPGVALL